MSEEVESEIDEDFVCAVCERRIPVAGYESWMGADGATVQVPVYEEIGVLADLQSGEELYLCEDCYLKRNFDCYSSEDAYSIHYQAGLEYRDAQRLDEALEALGYAAALARTADVLSEMADCYAEKAENERAAALYEESLAEDSEHEQALFNYSRLLMDLGKYNEARFIVERALVLEKLHRPDELLMRKAEILHHLSDHGKAEKFYMEALGVAIDEATILDFDERWQGLKNQA
jgi:tetratricopeptide (TPR) repeat protein